MMSAEQQIVEQLQWLRQIGPQSDPRFEAALWELVKRARQAEAEVLRRNQ